jgi:hypothetical protein
VVHGDVPEEGEDPARMGQEEDKDAFEKEEGEQDFLFRGKVDDPEISCIRRIR